MGSPQEIVHHSMSQERDEDFSNHLLLGSGGGRGARERDEKRRIREETKKDLEEGNEGSVVFSRRW